MSPTELANTVTGLCTLLAGVLPLVLQRSMGPHPLRWRLVWWSVVVTGVFTVGYHGFGESDLLRAFDTGSNIAVAVCIQGAVLGDLWPDLERRFLAVSLPVNAFGVTLLFGSSGAIDPGLLSFGGWGGYHLGELLLIADAIAIVALWMGRRDALVGPSRALLGWAVGFFLIGAALSTADSHKVVWDVVPMHATWHVMSAFGFVLVWGAVQVQVLVDAVSGRR